MVRRSETVRVLHHRISGASILDDVRGSLTRTVSRPIFGSTQGQEVCLLDQELFFISMAARMLGMHPQTLRKYERLGLIQPTRTIGSMRLYSRQELRRLKLIKRLVDDAGINLAGVQRLLSVVDAVERLRPLMREEAFSARDTRRRLAHELEELSRMLGMD
jgi:MerR family transcriptional regulator/heat shock protein HspR